jgi:hypothetical protein
MKTLHDVDLKQACRAFAVANTPLFLIRKLRQDTTVREISKSFSGEEILNRMKDLMARAPETIFDHAAPYAYLVALSLKEDDEFLRKAVTIPAPAHWIWFDYVANVLVRTYSPTAQTDIRVPGQLDSYPTSNRSDSPVQEQRIVLPA